MDPSSVNDSLNVLCSVPVNIRLAYTFQSTINAGNFFSDLSLLMASHKKFMILSKAKGNFTSLCFSLKSTVGLFHASVALYKMTRIAKELMLCFTVQNFALYLSNSFSKAKDVGKYFRLTICL